ncbi:MAG: isoprenyl transferase [Syntrophorhabdaceae bacterium]|nr:isoprenyl transferase [Syntrophorhabdaceae bacterium]MDD4197515.1 isoprenyl transferase [Syntrophorhabdaceae bacterium]
MKKTVPDRLPTHVAIIMDGNGRWAKQKKLKRVEGHRIGIDSVRNVTEACCEFGIPYLTLYAFSKENWSRPKEEVKTLMSLLGLYLENELPFMMENGVHFNIIGEKKDFSKTLQAQFDRVMKETAANKKVVLTIALSYSGRTEITRAVQLISDDVKNGRIKRIDERTFKRYLYAPDMPDPDLLIRTSGEMRVSNFLLWQIAYTEIYFTDILWPDFRKEAFLDALQEFAKRERRFGNIKEF